MLGNAPIGCWRPFGQGLIGTGDTLGNAQIVLETLWVTLSEQWRFRELPPIKVETHHAHMYPVGFWMFSLATEEKSTKRGSTQKNRRATGPIAHRVSAIRKPLRHNFVIASRLYFITIKKTKTQQKNFKYQRFLSYFWYFQPCHL
jgi:hypothetical protein